MSCSRKKKVRAPEKGHHQCQACGQVRRKKNKLCKARKIRELDEALALQQENRGKLRG